MTINTIGKSQGYYPSLRDFRRMQDEDYEGLSKTHIKSLKFWKDVLDLSFLKDDPYLESLKTIKDLHNQFLELPIWMFTFADFGKADRRERCPSESSGQEVELPIIQDSKVKNSFTKEELEQAYKKNFACISESAIKRDVKALLKMYSENKPENIFYELGLIRLENNTYNLKGGN